MSENRQISSVFELESAPQFPNLLKDQDFVTYNWTLPFCTM